MDKYADSFKLLKKTARSCEDIGRWFLENIEILPDVPANIRSLVQVVVEEGSLSLKGNPTQASTMSYVVLLSVKTDKQDLSILENAIGLQLGQQPNSTLYNRSINLKLPAHEWSFIVADILWELYKDTSIYNQTRRAFLNENIKSCFPYFSWDTYDSLNNADLLPNSYDSFMEWMWQHTAHKPTSSLPEMDLI